MRHNTSNRKDRVAPTASETGQRVQELAPTGMKVKTDTAVMRSIRTPRTSQYHPFQWTAKTGKPGFEVAPREYFGGKKLPPFLTDTTFLPPFPSDFSIPSAPSEVYIYPGGVKVPESFTCSDSSTGIISVAAVAGSALGGTFGSAISLFGKPCSLVTLQPGFSTKSKKILCKKDRTVTLTTEYDAGYIIWLLLLYKEYMLSLSVTTSLCAGTCSMDSCEDVLVLCNGFLNPLSWPGGGLTVQPASYSVAQKVQTCSLKVGAGDYYWAEFSVGVILVKGTSDPGLWEMIAALDPNASGLPSPYAGWPKAGLGFKCYGFNFHVS